MLLKGGAVVEVVVHRQQTMDLAVVLPVIVRAELLVVARPPNLSMQHLVPEAPQLEEHLVAEVQLLLG
jgi:hypothetical protein